MTPPRIAMLIGVAALAIVVGVGVSRLAGSHGERGAGLPPPSPTEARVKLAGSPAPLRGLHAAANRLLDGGGAALRGRLQALRGYPVVINKWASWCAPCRAEFPLFQRASVEMGRRVGFIGLDSGDSERSSALAFLRSHPLSYPSYYDSSGALGEQLTYSSFTPVTLFIAPDGSTYRHQGPYPSLQKLERDVLRYGVDA